MSLLSAQQQVESYFNIIERVDSTRRSPIISIANDAFVCASTAFVVSSLCLLQSYFKLDVLSFRMFSGDIPFGFFSDDEDGFLESIVFGEYDDERRKKKKIAVLAAAAFIADEEDAAQDTRAPAFCRERLNWNHHILMYQNEGPEAFQKYYRMSHHSFNKLADLLRPRLEGNKKMAKLRTQGQHIISSEMSLHCALRFLSGAPCADIRNKIGVSESYFYHILYKTVDAILCLEDLAYRFPQTAEEIAAAAAGFKKISSYQVMQGCIACIDGMLLRIQTPGSNETGNVKSYFSGHYQEYGINIQAACDSECRFLYCGVLSPGGTNDIVAYRRSKLPNYVESLPIGCYVMGDNAYICTEHMLTPFSGEQQNNVLQSSYNFFLSQCRIRIEMTFGRLVNRWAIFRRPLQVKLKHVGRLFLCATRLHNYCINERLNSMIDEAVPEMQPEGMPLNYIPGDVRITAIPGNSMMRDKLLDKINRENLRRPAHNLQRNMNVDNN